MSPEPHPRHSASGTCSWPELFSRPPPPLSVCLSVSLLFSSLSFSLHLYPPSLLSTFSSSAPSFFLLLRVLHSVSQGLRIGCSGPC